MDRYAFLPEQPQPDLPTEPDVEPPQREAPPVPRRRRIHQPVFSTRQFVTRVDAPRATLA